MMDNAVSRVIMQSALNKWYSDPQKKKDIYGLNTNSFKKNKTNMALLVIIALLLFSHSGR